LRVASARRRHGRRPDGALGGSGAAARGGPAHRPLQRLHSGRPRATLSHRVLDRRLRRWVADGRRYATFVRRGRLPGGDRRRLDHDLQSHRGLIVELLLALAAGSLYAAGLYLMLRRRLAQLIIGLGLLTNGTNILIFM